MRSLYIEEHPEYSLTPTTTMPILILGATGRTGSLILLEALRRGHMVTALVRTPSGLDKFTADLPDAQRANLTVVRGTPLSAADVNSAVSTATGGGDASSSSLVVISALSPRRTSENPWAAPHPTDSPPRMMADSIANVIAALRAVAVPHGKVQKKKIIHISALGVGATGPNANWLVRAVIDHSNFRLAYEDHEAVDEELRAAAGGDDAGIIRWVVPRPARLTGGDEKDQYKIWPLEDGMVWLSAKTSMMALAKFSLDAAEGSEWDGMDPIVLS